jgi:DNA-binding XRE family transcriptional regulator
LWLKLLDDGLQDGISDLENAFRVHAINYPSLGYSFQAEYHCAVAKTRSTKADAIFRKLLKELRIERDYTQAQVASRLGEPQSYVSKYETGERRLDFVETALVCEALGIGIEVFAAEYSARRTRGHRTKGRCP